MSEDQWKENEVRLEIRGKEGFHVVIGKLNRKRWELVKKFIDDWIDGEEVLKNE